MHSIVERGRLARVRKPAPDLFAPAPKQRPIAYEFVLDQLAPAHPTTRAMFGSTGVYLDERVVFILRQKGDADDGVWIAYEPEREAEVLAAFPSAARISRVPNARGWRKLAAASPSFEDDVLKACRIARTSDGLLGKIPLRQAKKKRVVAPATKAAGSAKPRSTRRSESASAKRGKATSAPSRTAAKKSR